MRSFVSVAAGERSARLHLLRIGVSLQHAFLMLVYMFCLGKLADKHS